MSNPNSDREEAFDRIVHEYYQAKERGEVVDPESFIHRHPAFRDELVSFFADLNTLGRVSGSADLPDTLGGDESLKRETPFGSLKTGESLTYIGEYRILDEIARGGMGIVFKARQEKLRRTVALKMILTGPFASDAEVDRFRREARSAAGLKHPNIVGVHEIGIHNGHHYFTMDYIESESLSMRLQRGSLSSHDAARILGQIATATHYAHQQGVLHRDLKPSNVLIDRSGVPHITDFGLAKPLVGAADETADELTYSGQILGTPSYMSPEQASAKHQLVGVASDIYSLGAILYACLSGRAPFLAESSIETLRQVIHEEPLPPRVFDARVPKDLENVCLKCLAKEPHRRYGTAEELAGDLQRFLTGRPVLARPISRTARTFRWAKRNPWVAATVVLLFLLALAGPVVAYRESTLRDLAEEKSGVAVNEARRANLNAIAEKAARKVADKSVARSKYFLAMAHWDAGRAREALRTLEEVPSDQRTMEWNLAYREFLGRHITFYGHTGEIHCVDASPDEDWIASASKGEIRIWNVHSGKQHRLIKTTGQATCLKYLDDSRTLLASVGNKLVVWDAIEGQPLRSLEEAGQHNQIQCFSISRDEKTLLVGTGRRGEPGRISYWDFEAGERVRRIDVHQSGIMRIDLSPDKLLFATVSFANKFSIRHVDSAKEAWPGRSGISDVAFHPGGYSIALLDIWGACTVLKATKGSISNTYPSPVNGRGANSIAWNPLGTFLAIGMVDGRIERVSPTVSFMSRRLGHLGAVNDIVFCSHSSRFVSVGSDRTVRLWTREESGTLDFAVENELKLRRSPSLSDCLNIAWSPDGSKVASGSVSNRITIWDSQTFDVLKTVGNHPDLINDIAFFPDGKKLVSACVDKVIRIWDLDSSQVQVELRGHRGFISEVEVSTDGRWVVSGDRNSEVRLWDARTGEFMRSWTGSLRERDWIRFSPDGKWIASIGENASIEIREVESARLARTVQPAVHPACIAFGNHHAVLWVGGGSHYTNGFEAWDLRSGDQVFRKSLGSNQLITSLSISPRGDRMLTADFLGTIKLWDTESWEELRQYEGDWQRAIVRFSPTDANFVSGSYSHPGFGDFTNPHGTIRVWDVSDQFEIAQTYTGFEGVIQAAGFSEDGQSVIAVSAEGSIGAWDRESGRRIDEESLGAEKISAERNDGLLAVPFDDRVRVIDLNYRVRSLASKTLVCDTAGRIQYHRMKVNGRRRGPSVAVFDMGWLIERGNLAEPEIKRLLPGLAKSVESRKTQYAKRYSEEKDVDLNLLFSRDVRRAIEEYSLDDPKWLAETEPDNVSDPERKQSALIAGLEIYENLEKATSFEKERDFDGARRLYREMLETMKAQTTDPFETLSHVGTYKTPFTINHLLDRLANLERNAGRPEARREVLKELVESIQNGMRRDIALDWRYLGQIRFELGEFEKAAEALDRYLEMAGKVDMVPEDGEYSAFLDSNDFYLLYRVMRTRNFRPEVIDGKLNENDVSVYRAKFKPIDCEYYNYFGITEQAFAQYAKRYRDMGFELVHEDQFENAGQRYYSAIWEKR